MHNKAAPPPSYMRTILILRFAAAAVLFVTAARVLGSDHADPMSLNVLKVQQDPEANITDLHAFIVDGGGQLITDAARIGEGQRLVISLCVRRALQPAQAGLLNLEGYKFRVHLDFHPGVRFFAEEGTPDGDAYAKQLKARNDGVAAKETA